MDFSYSDRVEELREKLARFMDAHVYPNESTYEKQLGATDSRWRIPPIMEELKAKARDERLWNLFLPDERHGAGLERNVDVAGAEPWSAVARRRGARCRWAR